ncbi:MAG: hypothetical protein E4H40_03595 [Candidatus Brocadiia bacterium]|nr:MAG: hypothetical protein E4H40_03595 [Candidatus Brocadiia bacterium]
MKKGILVLALILLCTAGLAVAAEKELTGTIDVTYNSRYIWRGFDLYTNDHSEIQPSIDLDLYGTGLHAKVWMSRANGSGFENQEEFDYTLYYVNSLFEGETYKTNYTIGWTYYDYPDQPSTAADAQEAFAKVAFPHLCPMESGIVPSYTVIKMWPAKEHSAAVDAFTDSGWLHVFGLDYALKVPELMEQPINLHWETVYNDGTGVNYETQTTNVDHDWSHMMMGASVNFDLAKNLTLTPGVYYQNSWEDTVNDDDETWFSIKLAYTF